MFVLTINYKINQVVLCSFTRVREIVNKLLMEPGIVTVFIDGPDGYREEFDLTSQLYRMN